MAQEEETAKFISEMEAVNNAEDCACNPVVHEESDEQFTSVLSATSAPMQIMKRYYTCGRCGGIYKWGPPYDPEKPIHGKRVIHKNTGLI